MLGYLIYGVLYITFNFMRMIGWWRWRVVGLEHLPSRNTSGMIIAMNHIHWIDIPVVGTLLPFAYRPSWLGKSELFANPLMAWFYRTMMVIPVRRGQGDTAAMDTAVAALQGGAILLIFPEGHRSSTGHLQRGRGGAVRLAMRSGVPIVPIAITGTQHGIGGSFRRREVLVSIGEAYRIPPASDGRASTEQMERLTTDMMQRIARMLPEAQRGRYALTDQQATTS